MGAFGFLIEKVESDVAGVKSREPSKPFEKLHSQGICQMDFSYSRSRNSSSGSLEKSKEVSVCAMLTPLSHEYVSKDGWRQVAPRQGH